MSTYYLLSISKLIFESSQKTKKTKELGILILNQEQPATIGLQGSISFADEISLMDDWPNLLHLLRPLLNDDDITAQFYYNGWKRIANQGNDADVYYMDDKSLTAVYKTILKIWKKIKGADSFNTVSTTLLDNEVAVLDNDSISLLSQKVTQLADEKMLADPEAFKNWNGDVFNKYNVKGLIGSLEKTLRFFNVTAIKGELPVLVVTV